MQLGLVVVVPRVKDMTEFAPMLTPEEMLERGVFGGNYFAAASDMDYLGMRPSIVKLALLNTAKFNKLENYYEAKAGESYTNWLTNGWIFNEDPLGWFHWYCRFASGRRHARDEHQIARQQAYGARWGRYARTQILRRGFTSPTVKQGLLQWAYDPLIMLADV